MMLLRLLTLISIFFVTCDLNEDTTNTDISIDNETEKTLKVGEKESSFDDFGEVLESMLHNGEVHVHSDKTQLDTNKKSDSSETFDVDVELEALLHDGDGHVHDENRTKNVDSNDGIQFIVKDPDHLLHDGDSHFHELFKEAIDGSRPVKGSDPTLFDNPQIQQATIGTINSQDFSDYKEWKEAKEIKKENGWFSGFSFMSSMFHYDMETFKERYLSDKKQNLVMHDEG